LRFLDRSRYFITSPFVPFSPSLLFRARKRRRDNYPNSSTDQVRKKTG
jgi:hypothetical protein